MRGNDFTDSEVFMAFAEAAEKSGLMTKKAEFLYSDFDISASNPELEVGMSPGVAKYAAELYGVTNEKGEDLVGKAHPGGGNKTIAPGSKDLGKVETIVEQHKINQDIAEKKPTGKMANLVQKLVALANHLDDNGFGTMAAEVDVELNKLANNPIAMPAGTLGTGPVAAPAVKPSTPATEEVWDLTPEAEKMYAELEAKQKAAGGQAAQPMVKELDKVVNKPTFNPATNTMVTPKL